MDDYNYLDTKGYECPIPVLKASKFIRKFKEGAKFYIESDDALSKFDFENFCKENKYKIISIDTKKEIVHIKFKI